MKLKRAFIIFAETVSTTLIVIAAAGLISLIIQLKQTGNFDELYIFNIKPVIVVSGSMEPTIMTNEVCIVEKATIDDVKVGDIVVFYWGEQRVIHRCIELGYNSAGEKIIKTQGDNNAEPDGLEIEGYMIKSRVINIFRGSQEYVRAMIKSDGTLNRDIAFLVVLGVVCAIITGSYLIYFAGKGIFIMVMAKGNRFSKYVEDTEGRLKEIENRITVVKGRTGKGSYISNIYNMSAIMRLRSCIDGIGVKNEKIERSKARVKK